MQSDMGELKRQWQTAMINNTDRRRTVDRKTYCGHATTCGLIPVVDQRTVLCALSDPRNWEWYGLIRIVTREV